jgi:hypothetical protein
MKINEVVEEEDLAYEEYATGRPAQVKGNEPMPKKKAGRTKHPFHGRLVGAMEETQINEALPALIPALITAIRIGGPPLLKWLGKKGAQGAARVAVGAGRAAIKRPITTAIGATGVAGYNYIADLIPDLPKELLNIMIKYSIPAAVVLGLIYGGKKLYDYLKNKEQAATTESIDRNLIAFIKESASAGATGAGGMATVINPSKKFKKPKTWKPTDNALDMKNTSLFGTTLIKR